MNEPRKYDMENAADVKRWFREMEGYFRCGEEDYNDFVHQGTDRKGREFAVDGFHQLKRRLTSEM